MSDLEDRRREAPDGPEDTDGMRQEVHVDQLVWPRSTKIAVNLSCALIVVIAGWAGVNIDRMREGMATRDREAAQQNAAILVEIAGIKASVAINSAGIAGLESRTEKLEGRR